MLKTNRQGCFRIYPDVGRLELKEMYMENKTKRRWK